MEEALRTKQVRLTRVLPFYPDTVQLTKNENTLTTEELLDPWKLLNRVYEGDIKILCPKNWLIYSGKSLKNHS